MKKVSFLRPVLGWLLQIFQFEREEDKIKRLVEFLKKKGYRKVKFSRVLVPEPKVLSTTGGKVRAKVYCFHTYTGEQEGYELNRRSEEQYVVEFRAGWEKHLYLLHPGWYVVGDSLSTVVMANGAKLSGSSGATVVSLSFPSTELNFQTSQSEEILAETLR